MSDFKDLFAKNKNDCLQEYAENNLNSNLKLNCWKSH